MKTPNQQSNRNSRDLRDQDQDVGVKSPNSSNNNQRLYNPSNPNSSKQEQGNKNKKGGQNQDPSRRDHESNRPQQHQSSQNTYRP